MDERVKSMMLRKSILSVVLTIAMLMPLAQAVTVKAAADTKQIDVLFTHDTHSHLDSFSTIVNGEQKEVGGFAKINTFTAKDITEIIPCAVGFAVVGMVLPIAAAIPPSSLSSTISMR